jgi:cell division protein FtsA
MHGVRLEVDTHIVTAVAPNLRSLDLVLEKAHIRPSHHTVSSLASAEAVMNRQQKEAGTLLLDIGAGTTNLVVIEDGEVQHVAVIPVGGINITNDLAIGLKTDLDIAEKVKLDHGNLGEPKRGIKMVKVEHEGRSHMFEVEEVHMITEARVEELLEMVDKELKSIHRSRKLPGGVVLTGGSSKLPGLAEFTRDKLQLAARLGHLQPLGGIIDTIQDPGFSAAVGLMVLDMLLLPPPPSNHYSGEPNQKVFGLVDDLWHRLRGHKAHKH